MWKQTIRDVFAGVLGVIPMKQLLVLTILMVLGTFGSLSQPFWGILLYYTFAVLRPQYLWEWALPPQIRWSLIAALVALVSIGLNLPNVIRRARWNMVANMMCVYGMLLLLSMLTSHDPATSQQWAIEYAKVLLMAVVATLVINRMWQVWAVALMVLITLGYIAWEVNYLYLFDGRLDIFHNGYNDLDNNGAGLYLAMGIPFACAFSLASPRWWQRVACGFIALLLLHAVMMTYSRGAMLSALVGMLWLLYHYRGSGKAWVTALVIALAVSAMAGQEIRDRFYSSASYAQDSSAQARLDSWGAAWRIALDYPLTGQGIRTSQRYIQNYGADSQGRTVHSQYLQLAADSGLPAMGVFIGMLSLALWNLSSVRRLAAARLDDHKGLGDTQWSHLTGQNMHHLILGYQAGLMIFIFGGIFLSLELVELPWLLIVVAGVLPAAYAYDTTPETSAAKRATAKPRRTAGYTTPGEGLLPRGGLTT